MTNLKNLIDFLPFEFKEQDTYKVDGKGILERFLEICGNYFQEDITKDIDNILDIIDIDKTQQRYLNYLWEFLGALPFARTGEHKGVPNLSDEQIRTILKYSISLLKIRGSRKFFEILFNMYGLTCTITDPTDGEMDKWEKVDPLYDTDYSQYDKYNYDKIYGCAQCIEVGISISGHGFTSPTPEFKAFKQSIDKLFDRFLPYNVSGKIAYGFDLAYNYKIVAEQYGAKYDLDDSISAFNKAKEGKEFEVKAKAIVPSITKEDLEKNLFKDVLGEYTTTVNGSSVRKNNVRLAGEKCNVILLPGEEFSYNQTVGKRTKENGFGEAGAYLNGETVQEVGGGVCQASSTLYNAVVLANLEVTERTNHTYISSYVPIGRDATVSWGGPDFKFKNNRDYPIKIEASYAGGKLTCKIIGTDVDGSYVKFTSERTGDVAYNTKYENDATIPEGQQVTKQAGSNGGKAVSYRLVYDKDGKLLSKKKEANSYYKGHEAIIAVGTMKVEQAPEAQPEATPATPETTLPAEPTTTQQ